MKKFERGLWIDRVRLDQQDEAMENKIWNVMVNIKNYVCCLLPEGKERVKKAPSRKKKQKNYQSE